jgi:hypothetical protein
MPGVAAQGVMLDIVSMLFTLLRAYVPAEFRWSYLMDIYDMFAWNVTMATILYCVFFALACAPTPCLPLLQFPIIYHCLFWHVSPCAIAVEQSVQEVVPLMSHDAFVSMHALLCFSMLGSTSCTPAAHSPSFAARHAGEWPLVRPRASPGSPVHKRWRRTHAQRFLFGPDICACLQA